MEYRAQHAAAYLDASGSTTFAYSPLADASSDIRLIRVWPNQRNMRTQVEMWNVSISTQAAPAEYPEYQCLSYTWGQPDNGDEIYLNGCLFHVRRNLSDFLRQAAQSLSMQPLWIDALCINQELLREKNIQVTRMGSIYHGARTVLVWLGRDASLLPLARYMAHDDSIGFSEEYSQAEREAGFTAFWEHPYWTRTWVTQEVLLARSIKVLIGFYTIEWSHIDSILKPTFQLTHRIGAFEDWETPRNFYNLVARRQEHTALNDQDIWQVLQWRVDTEYSITSDRIYALLSLVHDGATFRASYEMEPADLFWRVCHHFQAWSSVYHMQRLRVALRLTRHDIARSMRPTGSLVLELRVATFQQAYPQFPGPMSCSNCGTHFLRKNKSDVIMCSKLNSTSTFKSYTHILVQRQSRIKWVTSSRKVRSVYDYALTVIYDYNVGEAKRDLSHRALTYQVGENWKTWTPEERELLESRAQIGPGSGHVQLGPERWAVFLPPDSVLSRLDTIQSDRKYPWWEERWVDKVEGSSHDPAKEAKHFFSVLDD